MKKVYTIRDNTVGHDCHEIRAVFKTFQGALMDVLKGYPKCYITDTHLQDDLRSWSLTDEENYFVIHECVLLD